MDYKYIFSDLFDTFKVFKNLTVEKVNKMVNEMPQTIWQILNHLTIWHKNRYCKIRMGRLSCIYGTKA